VLLQPENRGTAAGVFLPLTYILARDPDASVVVYPSDHFIYPEDRFVSAVEHAVRGSRRLGGRPVLLAARPDCLELEYGWISPGRFLGWTGDAPVLAVETFIEKPDEAAARRAKDSGGLWNTMVLAAGGKRLWGLGQDALPDVMGRFDRLKRAIDTGDEPKVLSAIYETMPRRNFSAHLLQRRPDRLAVMEMRGVLWSDWGNPARIMETLDKIGKQPAFTEQAPELLHAG
jgi:mannose-1-phosphate guanylyltransferase